MGRAIKNLSGRMLPAFHYGRNMNRQAMLARALDRREPWDMIVIGGGATGVGVAVDAAARGFDVLLLEQSDFGKGTSSRSTKLVHGGVRYLEQGNFALVMEALRERGLLRRNAPHLVHDLAFIVPRYQWWEGVIYGAGLKAYNLLSGKYRFGPSQVLSRETTLTQLPNLQPRGLRGGVLYHDGQFDDARLLINLATTAAEQGAALLDYTPVTAFTRSADGRVDGVRAVDLETCQELQARARIVINATGAFCDKVRRLVDPQAAAMVAPSQGVHLVIPRAFLPGRSALMVPHTSDGRVMFAVPWHDHTLVGTTDTPISEVVAEPAPQEQEIDFLLETAGHYLEKVPTRSDILSMFAGIRPLVRRGNAKNTAALSRDHTLHVDPGGLMTITGGKWTTYRNMAEDCVNQAITLANLPRRRCLTRNLIIHGFHQHAAKFGSLAVYGADAPAIQDLIRADQSLGEPLHPDLPYCGAEVVWATRHEMARTVEDMLARRTRALFLNARAASAMAPRVAALMATELGRDGLWQTSQVIRFKEIASVYQPAQSKVRAAPE
jgi:glycerol-3-phosphate dehydrogenase